MSFNHENLKTYLQRKKLSEEAERYIRDASRGLARDVGQTSYPSVMCQPPSPKMGTIVNCESRTVEGAYVARLEFDARVSAYYEQPPMVECVRHSKSGRARRVAYYPDFLVLDRDGPIVVQTKDKAHLEKKCTSAPTDWIRQPDGEYVDIPAREAFKLLGLRHVVVSSAQLSKVETSNLRLLLRMRQREIPVAEGVSKACTAFVKRNGVASLQQISRELESPNIEPVYALLLDGTLHSDLTRTLLTELESCLVSADRLLLRQDIYELWAARVYAQSVVSTSDSGASVSQQRIPCQKHLLRALKNLRILRSGGHSRTARRLRHRVRGAVTMGVTELESMIPAWYRSGNRNAKRSPEVLGFCEQYVRENWTSQSPSALHRSYMDAAEERHPGSPPVSVPTFRAMLRALASSLARQRGGTRAANAAASPSDVKDRAIGAQRPFEAALCDHYNIDLYCTIRAANGAYYVVRPILTGLRDVCTGNILVAYPSLLPPSRRTCAVMLRMCLRRYGRLPESLVVDRGSDFQSTYFSGLMAHCGIELISRPSGHGRFGSEIERCFGQYKNQWIAARPGNIVQLRNDRAVSKEYKAHARAELSFEEVAAELASYVDWFNQRCPDTRTRSPQASLEELLARFPSSGISVADDEMFRIASAVDGGIYRVDPARGLHIGDYHYWAPELSRVTGRRRRVDVRNDPEDPYLVFALVQQQWVPCLATGEIVHDTIRDPVIRLARATVVFESEDARKAAKHDAEIALARSIRECDEARTNKAGDKPFPPVAETEREDAFARIREEPIDPLTATKW